MPYPIKYIENNLVWNIEGECFAYYELIPFNYSFLSLEQKDAVHDAFRQLIAQNRDGKIHALQISTESSIRAAQERSKKSVTGRLKEIACAEIDEQTENLMLPDCAKEPQFEKAYRLLNLSDHEFNAIRNGSLESLGEDRTRLILDKALSWAAQNYAGWDLYRHLRDELGMSNEEIGKAGFDLDEFYEDEAADSAEYEVEADYGEEL